ncbi:rod shape-determining protein MreD [Clostridium niameyense]|uniref:Rod shape-determining protein MreD n=1 Tax=Clostridium niameyense TaxID=1622073 RepID=A0A6M0R662_9CLOT|nr:rod shape-determining protein MreD [Clostridium niameyense]NEZ45663.1 rod shape-determining protein MreD [Clostridium niameyense]
MKRSFILGIILILLTILDNSFMPFIAIRGIYPSLLFIFIISYSIINGKLEGTLIGVFSGILQDIYFNNIFGINALLNMILCLIAAEIGVNIIKKKRVIPVITCFILSVVKGLLMVLINYILKVNINYNTIIYSSIYSAVIAIIMYRIIYNFCNTKYMEKDWKF